MQETCPVRRWECQIAACLIGRNSVRYNPKYWGTKFSAIGKSTRRSGDLCAGLAACATEQAMTVAGGAVANPSPKYRNAIAVRSVSGGQAMNILTVPGVSNEALKAVL
jgi:hypothetical protein